MSKTENEYKKENEQDNEQDDDQPIPGILLRPTGRSASALGLGLPPHRSRDCRCGYKADWSPSGLLPLSCGKCLRGLISAEHADNPDEAEIDRAVWVSCLFCEGGDSYLIVNY